MEKYKIRNIILEIIEECGYFYNENKMFIQQFNVEDCQDLFEELDAAFDFDDFSEVPFLDKGFRYMTLNELVDYIDSKI